MSQQHALNTQLKQQSKESIINYYRYTVRSNKRRKISNETLSQFQTNLLEKCPDVLNKLLGNKQNGNAFDQEFHDDLIKIFEAASACVPNKSVENEQIDILEPQDNNDNYETKQMDRVDINSDSLLTNESCSDSENSENSEGSDDSEDDDL